MVIWGHLHVLVGSSFTAPPLFMCWLAWEGLGGCTYERGGAVVVKGGGWLGALFLSKAGDYSWPRSVHVLPCFRVPYLLVIRRFVWKLEIWAPRAHEIACAITMRPRR